MRLPPTLPALVAFTMLVLLSLMLSGDVDSGLSKTLRYLLFAAFTFLSSSCCAAAASSLALLRVLVLSSTAAALYGTVLFIGGRVGRVSGPIGEANDFAYVLASVLPFAVYLALRDRRLAGAVVRVLRACWSRRCSGRCPAARWSALAAVVLWAVATRRTRVAGVVAGTVVVVGVLRSRFTLWRPLIEERLAAKSVSRGERRVARGVLAAALGWRRTTRCSASARAASGSRAATTSSTTRSTSDPVVHNAYLEVLAEGGVPTLIAFLAFIAGSWRLTARARRRFEAHEDVDGLRLVAAVQASLVVAIVSANFLSVQITVPLWLLGGDRRGARLRAPVKVALVTSIPHGGRSSTRCCWRATCRARRRRARGGVRRDGVAERFPRAAVIPLRHRSTPPAPCACTASSAAPTSSTRTTGVPGCGCGSRRRARPHVHGLPDRTSARRRAARLAYGGLERGLPTDVLVTPSHAAALLVRERLGYGAIIVVPDGVEPTL